MVPLSKVKANTITNVTNTLMLKGLPGRKDVEGPLQLLASCKDPKSKVTT